MSDPHKLRRKAWLEETSTTESYTSGEVPSTSGAVPSTSGFDSFTTAIESWPIGRMPSITPSISLVLSEFKQPPSTPPLTADLMLRTESEKQRKKDKLKVIARKISDQSFPTRK